MRINVSRLVSKTASRPVFRLVAACIALSLPTGLRADERVTEFRLENGLQVVVVEDHRAPVAIQMLWYKVGSADERSGESGLAHFLEHLMFKGTKSVAPGEFSNIVAAQGGSDNAFTSTDYTAYYQRVAADRLDLVMRLEADRMTHLTLAQGDVETERNVVLEERATRVESDPSGLFNEQHNATLWLNHPYGRPIIGWRHELAALNREAAMAFYKAHYAPDNAVLIVAGDVTPDEVRKLAEAHYGPIPASGTISARERPEEPPQIAERRVIYEDDRVGQPYLMRSYIAPARKADDQDEAAALSVLAFLLGGSGPNSALARALQFQQQLAVHTSAFYDATAYDKTTFSLVVVPAQGVSLEEAEAGLDAALAAFLAANISPEDFERVQAQLRAQEVYTLDNATSVAHRYGEALTTGLTVGDQMNWPKALQAVTPQDVKAAAAKVLDRRQSVTGWLRKETAEQETAQ